MNYCVHCKRFECYLQIGEVCCNLDEVASREWEAFTIQYRLTTQLIWWANGEFGLDDCS